MIVREESSAPQCAQPPCLSLEHGLTIDGRGTSSVDLDEYICTRTERTALVRSSFVPAKEVIDEIWSGVHVHMCTYLECGRWARTADRPQSCRFRHGASPGSRSVRFRAEIGCTPARNRSSSAPRLWCVGTSETGVGVCEYLAIRWGGSRDWRMRESGRTIAGRLHRRPRMSGVAGVAHLRALCVSRNRGIMPNSNAGSGHGWAPMCADPPHCTWEPERRTQGSSQKPAIPTKTSPRPTEAPVSHVQHRR